MLMPEIASMDHRYLFGTGPFQFLARDFAANFVTHDERRYRFTEAWFAADRRLSLGGPTVGWARQAARSMTASLVPGYLERIDLPILLLTAGQDQIVDPASHGPVAARLRRGEHVTIAEAKHEIMMETDDIRARFWEAFERFVTKSFWPVRVLFEVRRSNHRSEVARRQDATWPLLGTGRQETAALLPLSDIA